MALNLLQLNNLIERLENVLVQVEREITDLIPGPSQPPLPVPRRYNLQAEAYGFSGQRPRPAVGINVDPADVAFVLRELITEADAETLFTGQRLNFQRQWETLIGLKQYFLVQGETGRLEEFKNILAATWNIQDLDAETILQAIADVHRAQTELSHDHLGRLRSVYTGQIFLAGSVGGQVSLRDSDFDYTTPDPLGRMKDYQQQMYKAFNERYQIQKCWGSKNPNANIPLLHVTGVDRTDGKLCSIDFSCTTHTIALAREVAALPLKERLSIIAAKLFFKKLKIVNSKNRMTSSSFVVAYLCFRKDKHTLELSFQKFMAYFAGFDFHRHRMTSDGPELKEHPGETYEAYDMHAMAAAPRNYNTLGSTLPEVMDMAKEWMNLLSMVPGIQKIIIKMF